MLDSSFNPPTTAHMHLLRAAAASFGVRHKLLLLAKQNALKNQSAELTAQLQAARQAPSAGKALIPKNTFSLLTIVTGASKTPAIHEMAAANPQTME